MHLGCAALILLAPIPSSADVLTYSATTPLTDAPFTDDFSLPAFNSDLGALQSIDVSYAIAVTGSVTVANLSGSNGGFSGALVTDNFVQGPGGPDALNQETTNSPGFGGFVGAHGSVNYTVSGSTSGITSIDSGSFSYWEESGGGTVNLDLDAGSPSFSGGGSFSRQVTIHSDLESGAFSVDYTYSSVPEPSQYGFLVLLTVAGFFGWRRFAPAATKTV